MERLVEHNGTRLWSVCNGSGGLILCNGGLGCDDYLAPVSDMIEDMCRVVRFEPRGCGRSDRDGRYDIGTTVDDVDVIRRAYNFESVVLCGHSAGVDTALAYAIRHPDHVRGIVGISGGRIVNDREWSRMYHENLDRRGEDHGGKTFHADPAVNRVGNASWREYITRPTLLREISQIKVPVVFICAGDDNGPNWPTQQLAALLPRAEYVEIPSARHSIWVTHAAELRDALRKAIERIHQYSTAHPG